MLDVALAYTSAGWPVFPLEPQGKQPLGRLVAHGLKDASIEEDVVRRWWKAEPQANIAIPTGIIFDVADFDTGEAMERFAELCGEHDFDPRTFPRAKTGRGGRHLFMAPTGVGNRTDVLHGMDWRGKGGYVVVPDSIHPTGTTYEWIQKPSAPLPECPAWLLALITKPVVLKPVATKDDAPEPYIKAAVDGELSELRGAAPGTRNDRLNRGAYALGQMVGAGWILRGRAEAELTAAAYATGLEEPEVRRTIQSGLEDGIAHPRAAPAEGWGGGVIRKSQPVAAVPAATDMAGRPDVYALADLEGQDIPEPKMIVPGVLCVGLNMLVGKGKLGKSWLALTTALAVASGKKALNSIAVEQGEVLYLALEDTKRRMKSRTDMLLEGARAPKGLFIAHDWPKLDEGGIQAMEMWLDEHPKASLLIIDVWKGLRQKRARNANLYDEDYEHLAPLRALAHRYEVAVWVVHHTRKAQAEDVFDEISGTGGVSAALDSCVVLHRSRGEADGEIWITGRDLEESHLALRFEAGEWSLLGSASQVAASKEAREVLDALQASVTASGRGVTPAELASTLQKPSGTIRKRLFGMVTRGEVRRGPNSTYLPPVTEVMGNGSNWGNGGNGGTGEGALPLLPVTAARVNARAREGCPACGSPAYSLRGAQRRCHRCGELYGQ